MNETDTLQGQKKKNGIRLGRFHAIAAALFAVLSLLLLLSTYLTGRGFSRAEEATERYITAQQAAADMQAASDYLTAEARGFMVGAPVACALGARFHRHGQSGEGESVF